MMDDRERARRLAHEGARLLAEAHEASPDQATRLRVEAYQPLSAAWTGLPADDPERPRLAWQLGNLTAIRYLQETHDEADRRRAIAILGEVAQGDDEEHRSVARMWLGMLNLLGAFPQGALGPLSDLATHVRGGGIADFDAVRTLIEAMDAPARPETAQTLDEAIRNLAAAQPELPGPLAGLNAGLSGLAEMMAGTAGAGQQMRAAAEQWSDLPDVQRLLGLTVLAEANDDPDAEDLPERLSEAADALPPGDVLRTLILAELGLGLARRAERTGTEAQVSGLPAVTTKALGEIDRGHLLHDHLLRLAAGSLMSDAALRPSQESVERAVQMAEQVYADRPQGTNAAAHDEFLYGMALTMKAAAGGRPEDLSQGIDHLRNAAAGLAAGDALASAVLGTLGSVLLDRYQLHGSLRDLDDGIRYLGDAQRHVPAAAEPMPAANLRAILGMAKSLRAVRTLNHAELDDAVGLIETAVAALPPGNVGLARATSALGMAQFAIGGFENDRDLLAKGAGLLFAASDLPSDHGERPSLMVRGGLAQVVLGLLAETPAGRVEAVDRGIERLRRAAEFKGFGAWEAGRLRMGLGMGYQIRAEVSGSAADLNEAVNQYEVAYLLTGEETGLGHAATVFRQLADAYWRRNGRDGADRLRSVDVGLEELRTLMDDVRLQARLPDGLIAARGAADRARLLADRCLTLGPDARPRAVEALELGRGLLLWAATSTADVATQLRASGHAELADAWASKPYAEAAVDVYGPAASILSWEPPDDTRHQVLMRLRAAQESVAEPPTMAELTAALRRAGSAALVYLLPGGAGVGPGRALIVRADGELVDVELPNLLLGPGTAVEAFQAALRARANDSNGDGDDLEAELQRICTWAGESIAPLLRAVDDWGLPGLPRLTLVPCGALSVVPWHAARHHGTVAGASVLMTYAASGRQLMDATRRYRPALHDSPVLLGNPGGEELLFTPVCVSGLRAALYPTAETFGHLVDETAGTGTAAEVEGLLTDPHRLPSLLHLQCHAQVSEQVVDSHLLLARDGDDGRLSLARVLRQVGHNPDRAGRLFVLTACGSDLTSGAPDEALTLSTVFRAVGAVGVLGCKWPVRELQASIFVSVFHHYLQQTPDDPPVALHATQRWMLDPRREPLATMPPLLRDEVLRQAAGRSANRDLAAAEGWAAFTYQGC
ncbi:CHAT domain-containing protein [Dactylosporangium sp. CA-139066]|uniref:CHAT domain-containing protein n=1 Tax=Dactylosporangium sp. CA-139066 TaxID=3239930 RepID=UPI003D93AB37